MSRTNKHIKKGKIKTMEDYDDLSIEEQLTWPETGGKKFKPDMGRGTGISPLGKLVAKNANRSVIKAVRQKGKKEISKELE